MGVSIGIFQFLISFYKIEALNIQKDKMKMQEEVSQILYNLDQSIISVSSD